MHLSVYLKKEIAFAKTRFEFLVIKSVKMCLDYFLNPRFFWKKSGGTLVAVTGKEGTVLRYYCKFGSNDRSLLTIKRV